MERETRFELATLALARRCSTTELLPHRARLSIPGCRNAVKQRPVPWMRRTAVRLRRARLILIQLPDLAAGSGCLTRLPGRLGHG